jgi:hypothetical protein
MPDLPFVPKPARQPRHEFPDLYRPAGQPPDVSGKQRLVEGSHVAYDAQSDAATGHRVAASSPLAIQQQRRLTLELTEALHVEDTEPFA